MKPLIIGMGPAAPYPTDAWHPLSPSTANLAYLILGDFLGWPTVEDHFDAINLNRLWHRRDGTRDAILPSHAKETLRAHGEAEGLTHGRPVFLLGQEVTNFVFGFLRDRRSALAVDAWKQLDKCVGHRLCIQDPDARRDEPAGFYDIVAVPVWHPRNLTAARARLPSGWQQRMMNTLRSAGGLSAAAFVPPLGKAGLRVTDMERGHRKRYFDTYQMELTSSDLALLERRLFPWRSAGAIPPS